MEITSLTDLPLEKSSHGNIFKKVMIRSGKVPHITIFAQATLQCGDVITAHAHNGRYEIFLVEKGKIKIVFNGKDTYIVSKGSCIVTQPEETHEVSNPFDEEVTLTYFQVEV